MKFSSAITAAALSTAIAISAAPASALIKLVFDQNSVSTNNPLTGASATVDITFSDISGGINMLFDIRNTTGEIASFGAGATTSTLTAFAFDYIDGVTFSNFNAGTYIDTIATSPNNTITPYNFDVCAADNTNCNGGNANNAVEEGGTDTFSIDFTTDLTAGQAELDWYDLFQLDETSGVRFQQVNAGAGSDKLKNPTVTLGVVPVPAAGWLLIVAFGGLGAAARIKKKMAIA